jgi:hypothetical protein
MTLTWTQTSLVHGQEPESCLAADLFDRLRIIKVMVRNSSDIYCENMLGWEIENILLSNIEIFQTILSVKAFDD